MDRLKVSTFCSGIGACEVALKNLGIDHEIVLSAEIDRYARETYLANHDTKRMINDMCEPDYIGDEWYSDINASGLPCQSFSLAGKRLGELDKRGLLFYDFYRYVKNQNPKYFILENVKGLLSMDNGTVFQNWQDLLGQSVNGLSFVFPHEDSLMYNLHWKVLNTKDYGLPQNRERVFLIGIRKDLPNDFNFPKQIPLKLRLKDVLEIEVDEKYYLSEKMLNYFNNRADNFNNGKINYKNGNDIASFINASSKSLDISDNIIKVGNSNPSGIGMNGEVFHENGISPTLTTNKGEGIKIMVEPFCVAMRGRNPENPSDRTTGTTLTQTLEKNSQGTTNTLTSVQKDNLIVEPKAIQLSEQRKHGKITERDIIPTLLANTSGGDNQILIKNNYRIRKLTPLECFRLQGFPDSFKKPVSNSQLYKQAGNSISVPVIQAILKNLLK